MSKLNNNKYAVVGWGNGATAFATDLKNKGCTVNVYNRDNFISNCNKITVEGDTQNKGTVTLDKVTNDIGEAVDGAKVIVCCIPTNGHNSVAKALAPIIKEDQMVLLAPGGTGGVLEFKKTLKDCGCNFSDKIFVAEAEDLPYACRRSEITDNKGDVSEYKLHIYKTKTATATAGLPVNKSEDFFNLVKNTLPAIKECEEGIMRTSLNNINPFFHPIPSFMIMDRMMKNEKFDYYIDGFTPEVCKVVEAADKERLAIAEKLGIKVQSALEWLKDTYGVSGNTFYEALQNNTNYRGIKAPNLDNSPEKRDNLRYINEDMRTGLMPFVAFGEKLGVPTPIMKHYVEEITKMCKPGHFKDNVRTLESMGLADISVEELKVLGKKTNNMKDSINTGNLLNKKKPLNTFNTSKTEKQPKRLNNSLLMDR